MLCFCFRCEKLLFKYEKYARKKVERRKRNNSVRYGMACQPSGAGGEGVARELLQMMHEILK